MMRLLQLGRWFLLAMLIAWALILIGVLVVGKYTVRTAKELEQQVGKENQDSHRLAA
jgi:hypothetical protein